MESQQVAIRLLETPEEQRRAGALPYQATVAGYGIFCGSTLTDALGTAIDLLDRDYQAFREPVQLIIVRGE